MPKVYSFMDDQRQYRKLVNDGVLRTYKCCLCGKTLKPQTRAISDSGINHALKYHNLIPILKYDVSRNEVVTVRYYTGWPQAYVLSRDYAMVYHNYRPIERTLFEPDQKLIDTVLTKFVCSRSCPYIVEKEQTLLSMQTANMKAIFKDDDDVFLYANVGIINSKLRKALCHTGAGAVLFWANSGLVLGGNKCEMLKRIRNMHYLHYLNHKIYIGYTEDSKSSFLQSAIDIQHKGIYYPDYVFLKEYV